MLCNQNRALSILLHRLKRNERLLYGEIPLIIAVASKGEKRRRAGEFYFNFHSVVRTLCDYQGTCKRHAFVAVITCGLFELVKRYISPPYCIDVNTEFEDVDPDYIDVNTPLYIALVHGHFHVAEFLLDMGAIYRDEWFDENSNYVLTSVKCIRLVISKGKADVNRLFCCSYAWGRMLEQIHILVVQHGATITIKHVHWACAAGHLDCLRKLIYMAKTQKPGLTSRDFNEKLLYGVRFPRTTVLEAAAHAEVNQLDMMLLLSENGARIDRNVLEMIPISIRQTNHAQIIKMKMLRAKVR